MRLTRFVFAITTFVLGCANAFASDAGHNHYKWKDAQGNLHYDDALPTEALQFGYDVVNPQGLTIKHVDRAKTAAELKADDEAAASQAEQKHVADEQAKTDQQILAAYPREQDLAGAQQARLDMLDQSIHSTEISLQSQEKSLTEMLSHAADLERNGKPVPATLQSQIDSLRKNVEKQKAYIAGKQQEKIDAANKFENELVHYREVQAKAQSH